MLEHHAEATCRRPETGDVVATDPDRAVVGCLEAGEQAQRGGLAATRETEQGEDLALVERHVEPFEHAHVAERLGDVADLEEAHRSASRPWPRISRSQWFIHSAPCSPISDQSTSETTN